MRGVRGFIGGAVVLALAACAAPGSETGKLGPEPSSAGTPTNLAAALVAPVWQVGDSWQYSDGYAMKVVETNGVRTKFERLDAPKQWFINRGLFREESMTNGVLRNVVFRSENPDRFYTAPVNTPVVFEREYMSNGVLVRHSTSWVNEGTETITVPAGTFKAFRLVMRSRSLMSGWTGFERMWWVPELRTYVRMEFRYGDVPESARVLTSYNIK